MFLLIIPHQSCSQAGWAQAAALDPQRKLGSEQTDKAQCWFEFYFSPTKLVQQHGKSLQIPWTSLGRGQLSGMQDQAVLPCGFFFFFLWALPWVVFILPLPVKGLFNMWGCTADWASCALFYHLIAPSQVTEDSWILEMCLCLGTCLSWQSWAVALVIFLHVSPQDISSLLSKVPSKLIERLDVPRSYRNGAT